MGKVWTERIGTISGRDKVVILKTQWLVRGKQHNGLVHGLVHGFKGGCVLPLAVIKKSFQFFIA
jgi:hypothetical protein